jgi:hypothetical protein
METAGHCLCRATSRRAGVPKTLSTRYRFRGRMADGRRLIGSDTLSHLVPAGPKVTDPTEGAQVDSDGFMVTWEPVTSPAGVDIVT